MCMRANGSCGGGCALVTGLTGYYSDGHPTKAGLLPVTMVHRRYPVMCNVFGMTCCLVGGSCQVSGKVKMGGTYLYT